MKIQIPRRVRFFSFARMTAATTPPLRGRRNGAYRGKTIQPITAEMP